MIDFDKNFKAKYYITSMLRYYLDPLRRTRREDIVGRFKKARPEEMEYVMQRVDYYNRLTSDSDLGDAAVLLRDFRLPKKVKGQYANRTYFFDTFEYTRFFEPELRMATFFGDTTTAPAVPSIMKSRPIGGDNANCVVLNLDKIRHFNFVKDSKPFAEKKDMMIGRSYVRLPKRRLFMEKWFGHRLCDLGQVNTNCVTDPEWVKPKITIRKHLDYKFILCLEGNDVATNLKWVMSSNSLPVMPRPQYETWFMEGTLQPDYHYVSIADDYSDVEERLEHYMSHPDEAELIIRHNHDYVSQFQDKEREDVIALLVLEKYFEHTH